ncbi:MAG TPA: helix-turn-helix domain-containing protein [Solirubrobacteraceae bacterium]|nr:helix-turn-helix domain-containing protein [Solirubrobacteraceae bacterium]
MPEIGETLREARMRARIDVSEIEATTKIRAKYLRALENEEWDLLPGPTFVKSFLRTYGDALGLDGKGLVEEYRKSAEPPSEPLEPIGAASRQGRNRGVRPDRGPSRGYLVLVGVVGLIVLLLIVGLISKGGSSNNPATTDSAGTRAHHEAHASRHATGGSSGASSRLVSVALRATGAVYVCLLGEDGRRLVDGRTLQAGQRTPTYTAKRFELTLGNNSLTLLIDGTARMVPASSGAIGYVITKAGRRTLPAGHLPTCA